MNRCYNALRYLRTCSLAVFPCVIRCPKGSCYNALRPEALETFYVLYYYTRDPRWRDMGWDLFTAFERHSATGSGWAGVEDVMQQPQAHGHVRQVDRMESFVLAETLKYLILLFSNDDPLPLDKYVLTTEAHPLARFEPMPPGGWESGPPTPIDRVEL